jgi:hypothetical protein
VLDLKKDIYTKFLVTIVLLFSAVFSVAYFLLKELLLAQLNPEHDDVLMIIDSYNTIWAEVLIVFVVLGVVAFLYIKKLNDTVMEDVEHFTEYLEEVNKKNYDAVVQIQHYTEFLKMSLIFKNLLKRLKAKEKK